MCFICFILRSFNSFLSLFERTEKTSTVFSVRVADNAAPSPALLYHGRHKARTVTAHTGTVTGIDHPAFQGTSCSPEKKGGKMDLEQSKRKTVTQRGKKHSLCHYER